MRKLGIMFIINTMRLGGSESYVLSLAKELKQRGHKIVVLSSGGELVEELTRTGILHYTVSIPKHGSHSTKPVVKHDLYTLSVMASLLMKMKRVVFRRKPWKISYKLLASLTQLRKIIRENGIDIINSQQPGPTLLAYLASKLTHVPFVITVHGISQDGFPPIGLRFMRNKFGRIIVISEEIKEHLTKNYGIDEGEIALIHNGVDLASFYPPLNNVAQNISGDGGLRRVVHIGGSAGRVSNSVMEAAILVVQQVPDVEFVLLESGTKANVLAREINQQVGREVVKMAGFTKDIIKIINTSQVVIAVGRSALEAMACGKPVVIAGHRTGPLGGSFGGIVSSDNVAELKKYNFSGRNSSEVISPEKIAEAVINLLKDEDYRQGTGAFGRNIVEREFDVQKVAKQLEKVYLEVLEGC